MSTKDLVIRILMKGSAWFGAFLFLSINFYLSERANWACCPFFIRVSWRVKLLSQLENRLTEMLSPAVEAIGFELLGCEFVRAGKHSTLRLYIDHENGIEVDDCAEVSHQASAVLDVEDPISTEYNLEVSSPGMDRPLFKPSHFKKFVGEVVAVKTNMPQQGRRNFKGNLLNASDIDIEVKVDNESFTLAYNNINKANLIASFD